MARSSIDKHLAPDDIAALGKKNFEGASVDELTEDANRRAGGVSISRSAIGRWKKRSDRLHEQMRRAREWASTISANIETRNELTSAIVQGAHTLTLDAMMSMTESDDDVSPDAALQIATAVNKLASATKLGVDAELKIRAAFAREAAAAIEQTGTQQGWSAETVDTIKAQILGLVRK